MEGTNISVGRGTDTPFEVLGAPWINARELSQYLNAQQIPGVRFVPVTFTPFSSNFAGQLCRGVNLVLTDRDLLDGPELGIELASALLKLYPEQFHAEKMLDILANQAVYNAIAKGEDPHRIALDWQDDLLVSAASPEISVVQVIDDRNLQPHRNPARIGELWQEQFAHEADQPEEPCPEPVLSLRGSELRNPQAELRPLVADVDFQRTC